jgi:release factor glutamine methyltransferase
MYGFIKELALEQKSFLDVGCGSGLLSLLACKMGAKVTAIDIDENAVGNTKDNFERNFGKGYNAQVLTSDLFEKLGDRAFDFVIINPPYYFKDAKLTAQQAWYCGNDGSYFERLFSGLATHTHIQSQVYMILEENCEIDRIRSIGRKHGVTLDLVTSKQFKWEKSYIFQLKREQVL